MKESALVIEDLSALGQISMVAALTVLQSMNYTTAALPTAVLSTQTEGFGAPAKLTTDQWITKVLDHWHLIPDLDFNGALVGYIGSEELVSAVSHLLKQKLGNRPVIVDPVMADEGQLYPGLQSSYVQAMRELCTSATVMTPNWTELCLLTNQDVLFEPTEQNVQQALNKLSEMGITAQVVVTGISRDGQKGSLFRSTEEGLEFIGKPAIPGHFYGTGDTFAALLLGLLLQNYSLTDAVKQTNEWLYKAIQNTADEETMDDRKYGLRLGELIQEIALRNND